MAKKKVDIPEEKLAAYDRLIGQHPQIERKGVNNPYTSVNGYMFTLMGKDGTLGMRLPKDAKAAFEEKYGTGPFMQYGSVMREYVTIPDELLQNTAELMPYLEKSFAYTKSLPPK